MGDGPESITDELELEAIRRQSKQIRTRALGIAVGVSLGLLLVP